MNYRFLDDYKVFEYLSAGTLQKLFAHFGELPEECFSAVTIFFPDGSSKVALLPPTDFDTKQTNMFLDHMFICIRNLNMHAIQKIIEKQKKE